MLVAGSRNQERIEEFLRKSLLGEELINTQFHLFSARSVSPSRLTKPRVLCANNVLLAKSSKYFLDLLSSDINPSNSSLSDLTDANDIPSNAQIDDYGYESDSDLDDDDGEPPNPIVNTEPPKNQSTMVSTSPSQISVITAPKDDDEFSEDGSESVNSEMFVMSPEHPTIDEPFIRSAGSATSSGTAIQETRDNKITTNHASVRVQNLGSRHVLVKDTAFQTWYTLLNYLYTGKIDFLPLSSVALEESEGEPSESSTSSLDEPRCSAKSMYRLACKVGLDHLRDKALAHIRNDLTEQNILDELACSLASKHSQLLEMELDVLYTHIASPSVVTGFPALARRIANKEIPHGADIIIGIHVRFLGGRRPLPLRSKPAVPPPPPSVFASLPPRCPPSRPPPPRSSPPHSPPPASSPPPSQFSFGIPASPPCSLPQPSSPPPPWPSFGLSSWGQLAPSSPSRSPPPPLQFPASSSGWGQPIQLMQAPSDTNEIEIELSHVDKPDGGFGSLNQPLENSGIAIDIENMACEDDADGEQISRPTLKKGSAGAKKKKKK